MDFYFLKTFRLLSCLLVIVLLPNVSPSLSCDIRTDKGYSSESWNMVNKRITRTCGVNEKVTFPMDRPESDPFCHNCPIVLIIKQIEGNSIPPSAFENYNTTTILYLNDLRISSILPGAFESLENLSELHLKGNQINEIQVGVLTTLKHLLLLDLSSNVISSMKAVSWHATSKIKSLNLSSNLITEIEIQENWNNISSLDLSYNRIKTIDSNSLPSNLSVLNLTGNAIRTYDVQKNLSELHLGNNLLQTFNFTWINYTMNKLHLQNNKIDGVIGSYCRIIDIDLSGNKLTAVPCDCSNISETVQILNLANNMITYVVPHTVSELTNLKELHLEYNQIKIIKAGTFASLTKLTYLNVSHNAIQEYEMGSIDNIKNIEDFDISYNKITSLRRYIMHSFPNLKHFQIQNNLITYINATNLSDDLPKIWDINIVGNNLSCNNLWEIIRVFNKRPVHFFAGPVKNTTNVHGMPCYLKEGTTDDDFVEDFDNTAINGALENYFNHDFRESNFFEFLSEMHNTNEIMFNETRKMRNEMAAASSAHRQREKVVSHRESGLGGYLITIVLFLLLITIFIGVQGYVLFSKARRTRANDGERLL